MKILSNKEYDKLIKEAYEKGYDSGYDERSSQITYNDIEEVNSKVLFDFDNPDIIVYGVERIPDRLAANKIEHTLISYHNKEGIRTSWAAYCSRQMHEKLIIQFGESLDKRSKSKKK